MAAVAVQGRNGEQVEKREQEIEREHDTEKCRHAFQGPGVRRGHHSRKLGRSRRRQGAGENSNANPQHGQEHQDKVRRRPGQGHPRRAMGVPIAPVRVEGSAAPADHPSAQDIGENGYDRGAEDFAANVRQRIQRHLPAFRGREIATPLGGQGMRGFVTGQGKEEGNVPEKPQGDEFRIH